MKKSFSLIISFSVLAFIAFTGFECASTDLTSAKLYIQQKNYDKAIEALQKEVAKNPKSEEGYYLLGYLNGERDNIPEMLKAFDQSLAIGKKYEKEIKQSRKSYWGNNFNKGAQLFNKANQIKGDSAKIYYEKSAAAFETAIKIEPDSASSYKNLSYVYLNMEDYDRALAPLKKITALNSKDKESLVLIGKIFKNNAVKAADAKDAAKEAENYDTAIKYLEDARKIAPEDQDLLTELSACYIAANKTDVAMVTFGDLVKANPENPSFRFNYGVLLLGVLKFEEAEKQFLAALDAKPDYSSAMYNLAVTYLKWGAALQKKAEEDNKDNPLAKEKFNLAIPQLIAYVDNNPKEAAAWETLGKAYSIIGKTADAKAAFEKADQIRSGK